MLEEIEVRRLVPSGSGAIAPLHQVLLQEQRAPMWVEDTTSIRVVEANDALASLLGCRPDDLVGMPAGAVWDRLPGEARATARRRSVSVDGRDAELVELLPPPTDGTEPLAWQLREAHAIAELGHWSWDLVTNQVHWSADLYAIFELDESGAPPTFEAYLERVHPSDRSIAQATIQRSVHTHQPFDTSYRIVTGAGHVRWLRSRGRMLLGEHGEPARLVGVCQDITDDKLAEEELARRAHHDSLTGLPNRSRFLDRLEQALDRLGLDRRGLAVLFIDLDGFKAINDRLGHAVGDAVLVHVTDRLRQVLRPSETIARFGGDEFAVLCEGVDDIRATSVADRVRGCLTAPFRVDGHRIVATGSIGIAVTNDEHTAPETLLRDADAAMYAAKQAGRDRWVLFDHATRARDVARAREADDLRAAIRLGQLRVHFQPDMDLERMAVVGVEALVRWEHPDRGLIGPDQFIPLAEEFGVIGELGAWVLHEACSQIAGLAGVFDEPPVLAVNLSARQLADPGLLDTVRSAFESAALPPDRLCLEITETVLMDDVDAAIESLLALKALGLRLAIDDFGTGYSSLSYLRRFPVDVVKIDRSFVAGLGTNAVADAIVAAVINLSRALGLQTVAEGVEREEQLVAIRALHCDRAQGYLWTPPLPLEELVDWRPGAEVVADDLDLYGVLVERTDALRRTTGRPVTLQASSRLGAASADLGAVRTVLDHLLGNAVTYSPATTPIVVSAASDRHWVRVSVADFGVGMAPEESARCFEQFWQAAPGSPEGAGTGIGLYIVRSLVEAMGGHIGVKSARGKGSTFTMALPRSAKVAARHRPGEPLGEDSTIREFMRQIGIPNRRGS